jgi:hypothetical protein
MTNENLERLIKVLDGTQFEIENRADGYVWVSLKDPWEGVEFVEYIGQLSCSFKRGNIYKTISHVDKGIFAIDDENKGNGFDNNRINFKPSTEEDYVKQLKAKAFELYGEIKEGDRFEDWEGNDFEIYKTVFTYSKIDNRLYLSSWIIHEEGKWAKKLPKRIEVSILNIIIEDNYHAFEKCKSIGNEAIFDYMSKQLEKLLNDEVD